MIIIKILNLGFLRIGLNREWKKVFEVYWKGSIDKDMFLK